MYELLFVARFSLLERFTFVVVLLFLLLSLPSGVVGTYGAMRR